MLRVFNCLCSELQMLLNTTLGDHPHLALVPTSAQSSHIFRGNINIGNIAMSFPKRIHAPQRLDPIDSGHTRFPLLALSGRNVNEISPNQIKNDGKSIRNILRAGVSAVVIDVCTSFDGADCQTSRDNGNQFRCQFPSSA